MEHAIPKLSKSLLYTASYEVTLSGTLLKGSTLRANAFYKSKCPYVCLFVCLSVRHFFSLSLTVFLPPLPKVKCPNFLDIRNPWGKIMKKKVSDLKTFGHEACKIAAMKRKKITDFFLHLFTSFKRLFAPNFWSPMSKLFRYFESLGKSNGKKWSQTVKHLLIMGVKSLRNKKLVFRRILPY